MSDCPHSPGRFISKERAPSITEAPVRHCTVNLQAGKKQACDSDKPPRDLLSYETDSRPIKRNQTVTLQSEFIFILNYF
jgi:hypothetical protein